jgi:hypothetical protein
MTDKNNNFAVPDNDRDKNNNLAVPDNVYFILGKETIVL